MKNSDFPGVPFRAESRVRYLAIKILFIGIQVWLISGIWSPRVETESSCRAAAPGCTAQLSAGEGSLLAGPSCQYQDRQPGEDLRLSAGNSPRLSADVLSSVPRVDTVDLGEFDGGRCGYSSRSFVFFFLIEYLEVSDKLTKNTPRTVFFYLFWIA